MHATFNYVIAVGQALPDKNTYVNNIFVSFQDDIILYVELVIKLCYYLVCSRGFMMGEINTEYLVRCLEILKKTYELINSVEEDSIEYEMYRNSLVKTFEMTIEQSGKLLRRKLVQYFATKKEVDRLTFKDLFRYASKYCLLDEEAVERWFIYRDNRNDTAHDYGVEFAKKTLLLIDDFIKDVESLEDIVSNA